MLILGGFMKIKFNLIGLMTLLLVGCGIQSKQLNMIPKLNNQSVESNENEAIDEVITETVSLTYPTLAESIDAYLVDQAFNGVTLVASEGEIILLKGYGLANVAQSEEMSVNHQFHIASVSNLLLLLVFCN